MEMPNRTLSLVIAAAGLAAIGGAAMASEPYLPKAQKTFDRLDANKDGKISLAEFMPVAERGFLKIDENRDNAVSTAEIDASLQVALERRRKNILAKMDADKNGVITRAELDKYVEAMLAGADSDKDGAVSFEETRVFKIAKWRKMLGEASVN
jgi:Ca2+-binding EF-hand superfamily protein